MPHRLGPVISAACAVVLLGLVGTPAAADPTYPSDSEVNDARRTETAAHSAVATVEQRIAAANARLDGLQIAAARAVEAHNGARLALVEAERAEKVAADRASRTAAEAASAHDALGRLAAAAYRNGGQLSAFALVLEAQDDEDFFDGAAVLRSATQSQGAIHERWQEKAAAAETAAGEARRALADRQSAERAAQKAFDEAVSAIADQEAALASAEADHEALVAELAAARGTTVELEREREAALMAEQAAMREREALAAATADAASDDVASDDVASDTAAGDGPAVAGPEEPTAPSSEPAGPPASEPAPAPAPASPSPPPPQADPPPPSPTAAQRAIAYARAQLGKPYQWGAAGPDAFDCSGLTMRAWQQGGKSLPHWSVAQARAVTRISYSNIRPGDLVFWSDNGQASGTYHVGLYIGDGKMIHAPRPGKVVEVQSVFYWRTPSFYGRV